MKIEKRIYDLNGHKLTLRSAEKEDAKMLLPYLKRVCGETRFLLREADECKKMTIHMYESFGFVETGRIPRANKYDDGTYADDIFMVKNLNTK